METSSIASAALVANFAQANMHVAIATVRNQHEADQAMVNVLDQSAQSISPTRGQVVNIVA